MFDSQKFLPSTVLARVTEKRITDPACSFRAAQTRVKRNLLAPSGKLNILAADHPARRVTKVGGNSLAMADRRDYLARVLRVLTAQRVDGVMATMDILEDVLVIDGLLKEAGAQPLLDGKLLIASVNRGGLAGSAWELDDPLTGPGCSTCAAWRLDGVKFLLRVADSEPASLKTMIEAARTISDANAHELPFFLEPLPVVKTDRGWAVIRSPEALARLAGVASALGDSSRNLWLKLPYCDGYDVVARSTTLPILLLGGESAGNPEPFFRQIEAALRAGANVRGALAGRNVLYPGSGDPLPAAEAAGGIIHSGWSVEAALGHIHSAEAKQMDALSVLA